MLALSPLTSYKTTFKEQLKGAYPENSHAVFCPNKKPSSEPFVCLVLALERQQSFLFQICFQPYSAAGSMTPRAVIVIVKRINTESTRHTECFHCSVYSIEAVKVITGNSRPQLCAGTMRALQLFCPWLNICTTVIIPAGGSSPGRLW